MDSKRTIALWPFYKITSREVPFQSLNYFLHYIRMCFNCSTFTVECLPNTTLCCYFLLLKRFHKTTKACLSSFKYSIFFFFFTSCRSKTFSCIQNCLALRTNYLRQHWNPNDSPCRRDSLTKSLNCMKIRNKYHNPNSNLQHTPLESPFKIFWLILQLVM